MNVQPLHECMLKLPAFNLHQFIIMFYLRLELFGRNRQTIASFISPWRQQWNLQTGKERKNIIHYGEHSMYTRENTNLSSVKTKSTSSGHSP